MDYLYVLSYQHKNKSICSRTNMNIKFIPEVSTLHSKYTQCTLVHIVNYHNMFITTNKYLSCIGKNSIVDTRVY